MMNPETWGEFQETLIAYVELREKFDQLATQARYGRAPSAKIKIDRALYEISSKLRDYDGLLLQLCQSMGRELKGEIAELSDLKHELFMQK